MEEKKEERLAFWDILRGIGIVSIVFGHSQDLGILIRTVYYYHLVIFFFISGYFFNEEKYGDRPFEFFARRLKSMWIPYICYGSLFVLLHNFLSDTNLFPSVHYGLTDTVYALSNVIFLICAKAPSGAMWFIPLMLASSAVFSTLVWLCRRCIPLKARTWILAFFCGLTGLLGMVFARKGIDLNYHIQIALLVIPIYFAGYFLRKKNISPEKYTAWPGTLFCSVLLAYFLVFTDESVELSINLIPRGLNFYIISAAGIYLCCFLAKCLERWPKAGQAAAFLGKYSFDIMALHFLVFMVVDLVYGLMIHDYPENWIVFPHAYQELHILYLILGTAVPAVLAWAVRKVLHRTV